MSSFEQMYDTLREPKYPHGVAYSDGSVERISSRLRKLGVEIVDYHIDLPAYREYIQQAQYGERYPDYYSFNIAEKSLEHFVAADLLSLSNEDIYIDIASEGSPVPEIYHRLYGVSSYRQDLSYPPGLNGDTIGGDAASMPLASESVSKMALHCSFEHFEGDSDSRFIREIERVLRPGGMVCIVPLYFHEEYAIQTDPNVAIIDDVYFEDSAVLYCSEKWGNRHARFYDPERFVSRIVSQSGRLHITVYCIDNYCEVDSSCYARFAAVVSKRL